MIVQDVLCNLLVDQVGELVHPLRNTRLLLELRNDVRSDRPVLVVQGLLLGLASGLPLELVFEIPDLLLERGEIMQSPLLRGAA